MRWALLTTGALLAAGCGGTAAPTTAVPASTIATPATTRTPSTTAALSTTTLPGEVISAPAGPAPVIDGTIDEAEWAGAAKVIAGDGLALWWLTDGDLLYVAVRQGRVGSVNLLLAEGDRIRILHSSAALGSARYVRSAGAAWDLVDDFDWCCRVPGDPAAEALLGAEGWTASLGTVGASGEVEFAVRLDPGEVRVAVSSVGPDGSPVVWPGDLPTDQRDALYGPRLSSEVFDPERWPRLEPGG